MKRFLFFILALFVIFININVNAATNKNISNVVSKDYNIIAADGFNIYANLSYIKKPSQKEYSTVVLLHSLGYNSGWWGNLAQDFLDNGYAVIKIDLRGHGKSVVSKNLTKVSWKSLTNKAYSKYPDDVASALNEIKDDNKHVFFNDWAIVGCDIGASAGVIAADKVSYKPHTIIMISPLVKSRGLYIPVCIAQLDTTDFLTIMGSTENESIAASKYLKKFAQNEFSEYISQSPYMGMVLLKNDKELEKIIREWVGQYLH